MRSTFFLALLFINIAAVNCGPLQSNCDLASSEAAAIQCGNDVKLNGRGYVELVVSSDSLFVGVAIKECTGKVFFCYATKPDKMFGEAKTLCLDLPDFCGLIGTKDDITLTSSSWKKTTNELGECSNEIKMKYRQAEYCEIHDASCDAAISLEDGRIGIHVYDVSDECPVFIKYAKIYVPPTTTPMPSAAPPSIATTIIKHDKASEASIWPWIVLGVGIALILICIIIGLLLCWLNKWCMFKKKTAETSPPPHPVESIVSTTVTTKADENVTIEKSQIQAAILKKSSRPLPPSAEPSKKLPPPAKSAEKPKEKKAKTPPPPLVPVKNSNQKKRTYASPKKTVSKEATKTEQQPSTDSYSSPFCLVPMHPS